MTVTAEQADRLRTIAKVIDDNPDHFDMATWVTTSAMPNGVLPQPLSLLEALVQAEAGDLTQDQILDVDCGTTCCIAGWAVVLFPEAVAAAATDDPYKAVHDVLGVGDWVFYDGQWPEAYRNKDEHEVDRAVRLLHDLADDVVDYDQGFRNTWAD